MLTTFIPCGAKIPIIALFTGAIFGGASWVAPCVYFLGIFMINAILAIYPQSSNNDNKKNNNII